MFDSMEHANYEHLKWSQQGLCEHVFHVCARRNEALDLAPEAFFFFLVMRKRWLIFRKAAGFQLLHMTST